MNSLSRNRQSGRRHREPTRLDHEPQRERTHAYWTPKGLNRELCLLSFVHFRLHWKTSTCKSCHEFEASKYKIFSKCSTRKYYMLRNSCVLKPRIRGS